MATERAKADKVDLNQASRDELTAVPGIGPAAADAIIAHRRQHGRFKRVDDLAEVAGIGDATLEGARAHLTVSSAGNERGGEQHRGGGEQRGAERGGAASREAGERSAEAVRNAGQAGAETVRRAGETVAETARQTGQEAIGAARQAAELSRRAGEAAAEGYEGLFSLTRDNVEGLARASEVVLSRTSELNRTWLSFWQEQLAEGTDAVRALSACRSWHEALQIQDQFARASLERAYAHAAKSAQLTATMVTSGFKPLQESIHKEAERTPRRMA